MKRSKLWILGFWTTAIFLLAPIALMMAYGTAQPGDNFFEVDGDYGSTITDITDPPDDIDDVTDGDAENVHSTYAARMNSGVEWTHATSTSDGSYPYMGLRMYKVQCKPSPGPDNDRSEQMIFNEWTPSDDRRYFSFAFYIPTNASTPTNWLMLAQWHQDADHTPPLSFSWRGATNKFALSRYYDGFVNGAYDDSIFQTLWLSDFPVEKGKWYRFQFTVRPGLHNTGLVDMRMMNPATGLWEQKYYNDALTIGFQYLPDGRTLAPQGYQFKLGTYRGTQDVTTTIYFDNIRYGKTWASITKGNLSGSHKTVLDLWFDEGYGDTVSDHSYWWNGGQPGDAVNYNNDGRIQGVPRWKPDGVVGRSLHFDGSNYVTVPMDKSDFDFGNYVTVAGWFRTANHPTDNKGLIFIDEYSTTWKVKLYMSDTGVSFGVKHPDGTYATVNYRFAAGTYADGAWHHVVGTFNRFSRDGRLKLYIDGRQKMVTTGYDKPMLRGDSRLTVGKFSVNGLFVGDMDEVLVRNYAMMETEVAKLYDFYLDEADTSRPPPPPLPPPSTACPSGMQCCVPGPTACRQCIPNGYQCP